MPETSLVGARVRRGRWQPGARTFELQLEIAADGGGAAVVLLRYRNVALLEPPLPALAAIIENPRLRVAGETWRERAGGRQHFLRFDDGSQIAVDCAAVLRTETPSTGTEYGDAAFRFDVHSC